MIGERSVSFFTLRLHQPRSRHASRPLPLSKRCRLEHVVWKHLLRNQPLANADNIIECRADLRPGKLGTIFRDQPFPKHSIKLRRHTGKANGGGFGQRLKEVLRLVARFKLGLQCRRVANFPVGGVPARLMIRKIGFSLRVLSCVFQTKIESAS
ncbi:hypothetical protein FJ970_31775 (plasmid) [Mesorhizobium sp. B2-1-8]|uniref:hypothetical protein n=1 Tax=Mesorhizobium sp. B2-1-8 TaxID=2589967 RepID=UPI0015E2BE5F|nr:hypothetical protein [Mesorhizobium sp. B2-1-8]UCI22953.1 hypothetical protein FJ970_31775 [Mesorhizobium sp. B2-1-8]